MTQDKIKPCQYTEQEAKELVKMYCEEIKGHPYRFELIVKFCAENELDYPIVF